ncbi:hypothetical protein AwEntero_26850 [Enterobacterales bacterium]|nr:hypothetical protein AwEntero_26850 [Enterobacterales bacterium]
MTGEVSIFQRKTRDSKGDSFQSPLGQFGWQPKVWALDPFEGVGGEPTTWNVKLDVKI